MMDFVMKDDNWAISVLHVKSDDVPYFTVEYNPKSGIQSLLDEMKFVSQVPKELICLKNADGEDINLNSESDLATLGINEDDILFLKMRKMIRVLFSGKEHHIDIKDLKRVEEL